MILHAATPDSVVCVGQASHAWISGQLARAWGNAEFAAPDPLQDVCFAVEQHDAGMAEWDLHPALDPQTGRPLSFLKMPEATHLQLWSAAPGKVMATSPYAALLVSMHGTSLMRHREPSAAVEAYLAEQQRLQTELLVALGEDEERVTRNRQLLWALDHLSLTLLVEGWSPASVVGPGRVELLVEVIREGLAIVDPWPFAGPDVRVSCWGRRLEGRYEQEGHLHAALERAPFRRLQFTLRPG